MLPLLPIPLHLGSRDTICLGRGNCVCIDTNDCSVDPRAISRIVDVTADLEGVRIRLDGRIIVEHPLHARTDESRSWRLLQ